MNATANSLCRLVADRLLEGEKLAAHPELQEHAGSCLDCFRTLTELRDLPRITEVLRTDAVRSPLGEDPGPAFWNAMPGRIADEVLGARRPKRPARGRWWAPAALMTAGLAAAAFALVATYRPELPGGRATASNRVATPVAQPAASNGSADDLRGADLAGLSASELHALNQRLSQEETAAVRALGDTTDEDMEGGALERLASLETPELQRLTAALGRELQ